MRRRMKRPRDTRGFTFVEVLVAITLMIIGFLGIYASLFSSSMLRETANETNIAMFKLNTTAEYLFTIPFDTITTRFPEGAVVDVNAFVDSDPNNDFSLSAEQVTVNYPNGIDADPLHFVVTINWTSRMGTVRTESISTARAR